VRGKIACFTSRDPAIPEEGQKQQIELASRYFKLAHRFATEGVHQRDVE